MPKAKFICKVEQKNEGHTDLVIVGVIGDWWEGFNKETLFSQIKSIKTDFLDVYISSEGGAFYDALAIHDALRMSTAYVTAYLTGIVASAATIISSGADRVVGSPTVQYMIHKVSAYPYEPMNADEMRETAGLLDKSDESLINIYKKKTGKRKSQIRAMLNSGDTWMTAEEALADKFIDEIRDDVKFQGSEPELDYFYNQLKCTNIPQRVIDQLQNNHRSMSNENNQPQGELKVLDAVKGLVNGTLVKKEDLDAANDTIKGLQTEVSDLKNQIQNLKDKGDTSSIEFGEKLTNLISDSVKSQVPSINIEDSLKPLNDSVEALENKVRDLTAQVAKLKGEASGDGGGGNGKPPIEGDNPPKETNPRKQGLLNWQREMVKNGTMTEADFEKFNGIKYKA